MLVRDGKGVTPGPRPRARQDKSYSHSDFSESRKRDSTDTTSHSFALLLGMGWKDKNNVGGGRNWLSKRRALDEDWDVEAVLTLVQRPAARSMLQMLTCLVLSCRHNHSPGLLGVQARFQLSVVQTLLDIQPNFF